MPADDAAVGRDFSVRIEGSLAITIGAVCELDVFVQPGLGGRAIGNPGWLNVTLESMGQSVPKFKS
jgi:hypothetical protein